MAIAHLHEDYKKRKKITWFRLVLRAKGTLANTVLRCKVETKRSSGQWLNGAKE